MNGILLLCLLSVPVGSAAAPADGFFAQCPPDFAVVAERPLFFDKLREEAASLRDKWYAACLAAAGERPGLPSRESQEAYRLFWLDGSRRAVVLRVERMPGGYRLVSKDIVVGSPAAPDGGVLATDRTRALSEPEWDQFTARLASMSFWELPAKEERCLRCRGGTIWVLEGYRNGQSHVLHRRAPWDLEEPVLAAGLYLWGLSGLAPPAGRSE